MMKPDPAEFVRRIFEIYWPDCGDIDGATVQEIGIATGVLVKTKFDPEVHATDSDAEPGDEWYVLAHEISAKSFP